MKVSLLEPLGIPEARVHELHAGGGPAGLGMWGSTYSSSRGMALSSEILSVPLSFLPMSSRDSSSAMVEK